MNDVVYILEHVYEQDEVEEIKFIGVFSSSKKAKEVIKILKEMPGFNKHPLKCFKISSEKMDTYGWKEGFISSAEAME